MDSNETSNTNFSLKIMNAKMYGNKVGMEVVSKPHLSLYLEERSGQTQAIKWNMRINIYAIINKKKLINRIVRDIDTVRWRRVFSAE